MARLTIDRIAVLLVEPSEAQALVIEKRLRDAGVERIERVTRGLAALEEAERFPPDLIVSSLYLPDMLGSELLETLRQAPRTAAIPFLLISSETRFEALDPVRQAGAVAILPKPFTQGQVEQALYATLDLLDPQGLDEGRVDLEPLRVLLVDDSRLAREHMQRLLAAIGIIHVVEAADGREAIDILAVESVDLVISDYNMPRVDGLALTAHIRNDSRLRYLPVLMVTSEHNQERLAALQACGVSAVCSKPFDLKNIRHLIEQAIA